MVGLPERVRRKGIEMAGFPNKFPGVCHVCGVQVAKFSGVCMKVDGAWQVQCAAPCEANPAAVAAAKMAAKAKPPQAKVLGDLGGILALFAKAKKHLKFPAIVFGVPVLGADGEWVREKDGKTGEMKLVWSDISVRVHLAGEKAKFPGSLTVVDADKDRDCWFGRVLLDGLFQQSKMATPAIAKRLGEFAADPAKVAGEDGRLHGRCCFCRLPLTDERSTAVGYGPVCADHFELPWGEKPAPFFQAEAA